jgi:hypothetical protein
MDRANLQLPLDKEEEERARGVLSLVQAQSGGSEASQLELFGSSQL